MEAGETVPGGGPRPNKRPPNESDTMPKTITVGVITNAQGAHLDAYFTGLAQTEEAEAVVLSDPSGQTVERAKKALGMKLKETFKDAGEMLKKHQPAMALVSL